RIHRATTGASGPKTPRQRTGAVVSRLAPAPDKPVSRMISGKTGATLESAGRRFSATRIRLTTRSARSRMKSLRYGRGALTVAPKCRLSPRRTPHRVHTSLRVGSIVCRRLGSPRASFDKLRMRVFHRATKIFPHPELVEGRRMALQRCVNLVVLLRHKLLCRVLRAIGAAQQGHRERVATSATLRWRRMVAIELGM